MPTIAEWKVYKDWELVRSALDSAMWAGEVEGLAEAMGRLEVHLNPALVAWTPCVDPNESKEKK